MALIRCPECHKKISESAQICPHCGFSFKEEDLEKYKKRLKNGVCKISKLIAKIVNYS